LTPLRSIPRSPAIASLLAAVCVLLWPGVAASHALLHELVEGETVVVRLYYPGEGAPSFELYELLAPEAEVPFQTGRVNLNGEVSFRPDRAGRWQLRVFTEDGHGASIDLQVDSAGAASSATGMPALGHWSRVGAALGYLLGAFGLLALWQARRRKRA
jgi:nickel transport protein